MRVFLLLFILLICSDVFAKETLVKQKKFRHCDIMYYDTEALCDRDVCEKNKNHNNYDNLCQHRGKWSDHLCGEFVVKIKFNEFYKKIFHYGASIEENNMQCFLEDLFQMKCNVFDIEGEYFSRNNIITDNCRTLFLVASKIENNNISVNKAFLNKQEQQKFCKHLKECSAIVEEVLKKEGKIK